MKLLIRPIFLLVFSISIFSSCEPTYDELVQEQIDLLIGKSWEQVSEPCSENSISYNLIFNSDFTGIVERTFLQYDTNDNLVFTTETNYINWYTASNYRKMLFTIEADYYTFNVISVTEDRLTFTDYSNSSWNSCIHELK